MSLMSIISVQRLDLNKRLHSDFFQNNEKQLCYYHTDLGRGEDGTSEVNQNQPNSKITLHTKHKTYKRQHYSNITNQRSRRIPSKSRFYGLLLCISDFMGSENTP